MTTTTSPLAALLAQLSPHKKEKGDQFELLAKWWLETDPVYKAKFVWVEHFKDWEGRWTNKDLGTDLVAKDINGKIWSIQAKGYKLGAPITHKDMGTWLSDSHRDGVDYRLLITSTNAPGPHSNATTVFDGQTDKPVVIVDRTWLEESTVNWPVSLTELYAPQPLPKTPRPYQLTAIKDVLDGFEKTDRGQLLMVSGTGKTLTGLFINEQLESKNTLVLLPSLLLLKQTLKVYRANSTVDFKSLPVGSDATANNFGLNVLPTSLGFESTTDATTVAEFLRENGVKVVFSTYQSSSVIAEAHAMADVPDFDLVIADEAHNTAGALDSYFATVLHDEKIKATRRLFMTATPKNFTPRVLQRAIEVGDERASMDDEKRYGTVFHELSYAQALKDKLVTDYRIAIIAVKEEELREWAERGHHVKIDGVDDDFYKLAPQVAVLKAMRKYGIRRMITFHNRVDRAKIFADTLPQALAWLPEAERPVGSLWAKHIHGDMSVDNRTLLLDQLGGPTEGQLRVLANARVLTEGVDVPALDGIAILDPKRSAIAIYQAQGRAIRLDPSKPNPTKEIAYTILPVFVPAGSDDVDDQAILNSSAFEPVWHELLAMRMFDERFAEWVDGFRLEKGKPGRPWKPTIPSMVEENLHEVFGEDFANAFAVKVIKMTTASWEEYFGAMEWYLAKKGTMSMPKHYVTPGGIDLERWQSAQREAKAKGDPTLTPERIARLEAIGFVWDPDEARWMEKFELTRKLAEEKGSVLAIKVADVIGDFKPYRWIIAERQLEGKDQFADRIELLKTLPDWVWNTYEAAFEAGLAVMKKYRDVKGHANPSSGEMFEGFAIYGWANKRRTEKTKKDPKLTPERIAALDELGFVWSADEARWMKNYTATKVWMKQNGNVMPPVSEVFDDCNIGTWGASQRVLKRKDKLADEREELLGNLTGWEWEPASGKASRHWKVA